LAICRRLLGDEHPDTLTVLLNLAQTMCAQNDLIGARKLQERVVMVRRRVLGEEHPGTLNSMNILAQTLRAQGDLAGARTLEGQAVTGQRRLSGQQDSDAPADDGKLDSGNIEPTSQ
jgi:hypothetical protein